MAALIRQANSGYELVNKPKTKTDERRMVEEKREKTKQRQQQQTLSEKKEEAGNVSEQRDKGRIHVIRVHDTTHLAVTTTLRGTDAHETTPLTRTS